MKIAVVILNFNGKDFLEKFLPNVIKNSQNAEVIVADNCSTDTSVEFLKSNYPDIRIIQNPVNGGFASGYNEALKHVTAEYYVLLNSDVQVTENWLEPCISLLDSDSQIAALQPKVLAFHDKTLFEHAGAAGGYLDKNYYPFCQGRIFEEVEKDTLQYNVNKEIFWATGACLFIRAELYHEFNGLDDDFFAHMEEIDLCWRLKKQNHKIYYCAESTVYHVGGGTLNYMSPKKTYLNFRNSLFMIAKNHEGNLFFKMLHRLFLDGFAGVMFLIKFQFPHIKAVFMAHVDFYRQLKQLLAKRKIIKSNSTTFNKTGLYHKSIINQKFLFGVKSFNKLKSEDFS